VRPEKSETCRGGIGERPDSTLQLTLTEGLLSVNRKERIRRESGLGAAGQKTEKTK
jgi:hypothetical protein